MIIYNIPAYRAFDILRWRSQHTNVRLRELCEQLVERFSNQAVIAEVDRVVVDHILMTLGVPADEANR